ncbi:AAA family ATPase [Spirosoma aerophilum]
MPLLTLERPFKSLLQPFSLEIPNLVVLSGINGGGKSHLLTSLENNQAKIFSDSGIELKRKRLVLTQHLMPSEQYVASRESMQYEFTNLFQLIQSHATTLQQQPDVDLNHLFSNNLIQAFILKEIIKSSGIPILKLKVEDIKEHYPVALGNPADMFQQNFSNVFKRYLDRLEDNMYFKYLNEVRGVKKNYISDQEFIERHGEAPWDLVNKIFSEAEIDYRVNNPIVNDRDLPFQFLLINKTNGAEVPFSDLSSGEKVLMSLALALYNSRFDLAFPDVLLLDELDAHLHPSMAKQLLRVLNEVFVKEKGVNVIMTTHSPSTVALAPEESLFIMQRESPRMIKQTQEQVLRLLTDGIPSFSIYTDNRRQVYTESDTDVEFYTKLYGKLKKSIPSDRSLYFMSSGALKSNTGNSSQVRDIVNQLVRNGNKTVYGIIDWDGKNIGNQKIFVLGSNVRYSIENYIFDPIIFIAFLLREDILSKEIFGLDEDEQYFHLPSFPAERLQRIVNIFFADFIAKANPVIDSSSISVCLYHGGLELQIPSWYLKYRGHDLEDLLKVSYHQLNKFRNPSLKMEIIKRVIGELPTFIPWDIVQLFQTLQNA